ncbi:MAG: ORF6N domain-containing protein [Pseudomonadota bacterium]
MEAFPPNRIIEAQGVPAVLDADLAAFFETTTSAVNQAVSRNQAKFGPDAAFRLSEPDLERLTSQGVIAKPAGRGGRRNAPRAFTETGVVMLATVLRTDRAVAATRHVVEAFVELRRRERERRNAVDADAAPAGTPAPLAGAGVQAQVRAAVVRLLETIVDPTAETTVADETRALLIAGLDNLKARLDRKPLENEKLLAEIAELHAKFERRKAEAEIARIEVRRQRLAQMALDLLFVFDAQRWIETGDADAFRETLSALADRGGR